MRLSLSAVHAPLSVPSRGLLFVVAVVLGAVGGNSVNIEPSDWAYNSLLRLFADPGVQIAGLTTGLAMGFVLGFIHLTSI
jgi:hypothetical protein